LKEVITYKSENSIDELHLILINHFKEKPHCLFSQKTWSGKVINSNEFIIKSIVDIDLENYVNSKPYIIGRLIEKNDSTTIVTLTVRHTYLLSIFIILPILVFCILWLFCVTNEKYYEYVVIPKIMTVFFTIFQILTILILRYNILNYYEKLLNLKKE
jgi:hypothetical protein